MVYDLNSPEDYKEKVKKAPPEKLVVVDFHATWCGPCRMIAPKIVEFSRSDKFKDVEFYKLDTDAVPAVAQECGIRAMPTFLLFRGGEQVHEIVGADHKALEKAIQKAIDDYHS